jgi:hypothetical protein
MKKLLLMAAVSMIALSSPMGLLFAGGPEAPGMPGTPPVGGGSGQDGQCHADVNKWTCTRSQCWLRHWVDLPGNGAPGNRNGEMRVYPGKVVSAQVSVRFAEEKTPPLVCKPDDLKQVRGTVCERQYVLERCRE